MNLSTIDLGIIIVFFLITISIGLWASKRGGKSAKDFFLSGRDLPWWLIGVSMVATTFSADTPNFVTDVVRQNGVAGNWEWWAFLLTGMSTVFIYAKLWRRSGITTDLEFYELRYSGIESTILRGFRAIYLGVFFNVMIMATVMLAGIKISSVMLGLSSLETVLLVSVVTVFYSAVGGLRGVIMTDFFQFVLSMIGMIIAAIYIINLPEIGSVSQLISHPNVSDKIDFFPDFSNMEVVIPLLIIPIAVQWWNVWYPGAEPGGGGYVAQRMLSTKSENDAIKATLFFNIAHYALRPWPWILIALASLIIFPELSDIENNFPLVDPEKIKHDIAFPAMLTLLPKGLLGLVLASLIAALMSTISTHLNWGASYLVHDFYVRFIDQESSEKTKVFIGRISTVVLMILAAAVSLLLSNALQAFKILLQIGAGTGLLFILRWFWWRINAYSEITAMIVSLLVAIYFEFINDHDLVDYQKMLIGILITSICWISVTFFTRPTSMDTLRRFFKMIQPYSLGWKPVVDILNVEEQGYIMTHKTNLAAEILMMFIGCIMIYGALFSTGYLLYGYYTLGLTALVVTLICVFILNRLWVKNYN